MLVNPQLIPTGKGWPVATRALALTLRIPIVISAISLMGYASANDGGEGLYNRVGGAPAHAGYFQTADGSYWELSHTAPVSPLQFGAVGGGADDTTPVQNTVTFAGTYGLTANIPASIRFGAITVAGSCKITGIGTRSIVTPIAGSYNLFTITSSNVTIENLYIDSASKTGGIDFYYNCGTTEKRNLTIRNTNSVSSYGVFADTGSGLGAFHINTRLESVHSMLLKGQAFTLTRLYAYCWLIDCTADFVNTTTNSPGFVIDLTALSGVAAVGGLTLQDCNVLGSASAATTSVTSQRGYGIANCSDVIITNCAADGVGEYAWIFSAVNKVKSNGLFASLSANAPIYLDTVSNSTFTNTHLGGRKGLPYSPTADGIYFNGGCYSVTFSGGMCRDITGNCVNKAAAQAGGCHINGFELSNCGGYSFRARGSSGFVVSGVMFFGNANLNFDMTDSFNAVTACQNNAGALVPNTPSPATG